MSCGRITSYEVLSVVLKLRSLIDRSTHIVFSMVFSKQNEFRSHTRNEALLRASGLRTLLVAWCT